MLDVLRVAYYVLEMIQTFRDAETHDLFVKRRHRHFASIAVTALRKLNQIEAATALDELRSPPGNRLEALKDDRAGQHSIRVNDQFRICFIWKTDGAYDVEIVDYHLKRGETVSITQPKTGWKIEGVTTHPGAVLREDFLAPLGMSAHALALQLRVAAPRVHAILHEKRAVTPDTAMRLARYFRTSAQFWMNLQSMHDLTLAQQNFGAKVEQEIEPLALSAA